MCDAITDVHGHEEDMVLRIEPTARSIELNILLQVSTGAITFFHEPVLFISMLYATSLSVLSWL